jgi:hypothetical protein
MLRLFQRKMIFVVKYFRRNHFFKKMIFLKIFFGVWLAQKNYERRKLEYGKCRRNPEHLVAIAGFRRAGLAGFRPDSSGSGHIRADLGHFGQIRPDPSRTGQIPTILARSDRLLTMARLWPILAGISAPARFRWPDVAEFRRWPDSNDRQLLNSGNRISNERVKTKSLISKNDLRFSKS